MEVGAWTTVVTCVAILVFCAVCAPVVHSNQYHPMKAEHYYEDVIMQEERGELKNIALLPNPAVMESRRQSLIEHIIKNVFFLCMSPNTPLALQNDILNLYTAVKPKLKVQMSLFDVLCQSVKVNSEEMQSRLTDSCDKFFIDLFAQKEQSLYPGFDTEYSDLVDSSTHADNSIILVDANQYQITKNTYTPKYIKYNFDSNYGLLRANFYNNGNTTIPTYFVLSHPFAIEFEQLGIFNIICDVNNTFNIMNYYNTEKDTSQLALYLAPTIAADAENNKLNYLEMNYALQNVSSIIDTTARYKQIKLFYLDFEKQGVNTSEFHNLTVGLSPKSIGTFAASYSGNATNFVTSTTVNFADKTLSVLVDNTRYDAFLQEVNDTLQASTTSEFHLFVNLHMNVLSVYLMYKKNIYDHHLIIKRTPLVQTDMTTPYVKVFAFDPDMGATTNYVNGHNNTFNIMPFVPNFLRLSQTLGYNFKI